MRSNRHNGLSRAPRHSQNHRPGTRFKGARVGARVEAQVKAQDKAEVEAQVDIDILRACADGPKSSDEIAEFLGHKQLSGNIRKALPRLREAGLIEYTIPDKPNSRLQKY
jgi:hypothetical protein